jgi:hypothetical protein
MILTRTRQDIYKILKIHYGSGWSGLGLTTVDHKNGDYIYSKGGFQMFKKIRITFFIGMVFALATICDGAAQEQSDYQELLNKAKAADKSLNFKALRVAYTHTPDYNPYGRDEHWKSMETAYLAREYDKVIPLAEKVLEKNYVDIDGHFFLFNSYQKLNNKEKADFHNFMARGLISSILKSGDGKTPETAFLVINLKEEYIALAIMGLKGTKQSLIKINDHHYDKVEAKDPDTGQTSVLYFNVDAPMNWLKKEKKL